MKNRLLFLLVLTINTTATTQNIVDTNIRNRNAIIEQFNGGRFCPDAHRISDSICKMHPNNVVDVRYYEFYPSYKTMWGDSIWYLASTMYYPMGTINRHLFGSVSEVYEGAVPYGQPCISEPRGEWAEDVDSILSMLSPVNIAATASIDDSTRVLTVSVELYYTNSSSSPTNNLNVLLLQNNLLSNFYGASEFYPEMINENGEYRHMHVLRDMITGQWGEPINTTTAGSFVSRTYYYTIPDSIGGVPVDDLCNLEVVAFIAENHQEILSACRAVLPSEYNLTLLCDETKGNVLRNDCYTDNVSRIYAVPNDGFRFVMWDNGSTNNPETIVLDADTTITAIFAPILSTPQICMVSVENNHNVIRWNNESEATYYRVYRESIVAGEYEAFAEVPSSVVLLCIDSNSHPSTRSYRYKISGVDEYGIETQLSPEHKTMHLTINQGIGGRWNLQWTPYEGAEYTTYIIYRGISADSLEQIDIMPADGNTSYTDEEAPNGDVYYQVGIVMRNSCLTEGTKTPSISRSNVATNSAVGLYDIPEFELRIYSHNGRIIVDGANGESISVYDMIGRNVNNEALPNGVYMIKIGNRPAHKVVMIR